MTMTRLERWVGYAFVAELLLILVLGSIGAWQLGDRTLQVGSVLGGIAWCALIFVTLAPPASSRSSWKGTSEPAGAPAGMGAAMAVGTAQRRLFSVLFRGAAAGDRVQRAPSQP